MLRLVGPAGFILAYNITYRGPSFFVTEFPKAWQREYEKEGYSFCDPILLHSLTVATDRRWSEIKFPDARGMMKRAKEHGLAFGAVFSRKVSGKRTVLSVAREDRETSDDEMVALGLAFDDLMVELSKGVGVDLTLAEVETLRCSKDGLTHDVIAQQLGVSVPTVKARRNNAKKKLGARNVTAAVVKAVERKLI